MLCHNAIGAKEDERDGHKNSKDDAKNLRGCNVFFKKNQGNEERVHLTRGI